MRPITRKYGTDTYFLETCDAFAQAGLDAGAFADRHTLLLLKPDAAVTGAMRPAVSWLLDHGYRIVGAYAVRFTPLHIRALWYFNWHHATRHRRRLADRLAGMSPSLVVIVTHPDQSVPVSVRLTTDKGPADPAQREPHHLRYALNAGTYLLNLVHTPDSPDDVLREMSIYFGEPLLGEVIAACRSDGDASAEAMRLAGDVESGVERKSGDLTEAQDAVWEEIRATLSCERPRSADGWVHLLEEAARNGVALDPWYCTVIESAFLPMHRT